MQIINLVYFTIISIALFFNSGAFAQDLYIKSTRSTLYENASSKSKKLMELKRGDIVQLLSKKSVWSNIKVGTTNGWIYAMMLTPSEPKKKLAPLAKSTTIASNQRVRASLYSGTAAARGLTDSEAQFNPRTKSNFSAVQEMEGMHVSEIDALTFIRSKFELEKEPNSKSPPLKIIETVPESEIPKIQSQSIQYDLNQLFHSVIGIVFWNDEKQTIVSKQISELTFPSKKLKWNIAKSIQHRLFQTELAQENIAIAIQNGVFNDLKSQEYIVSAIQNGAITHPKALQILRKAKSTGAFYKWTIHHLKEEFIL